MYVYICTCMCTYLYMYMYMYVCMYVCMYICIYMIHNILLHTHTQEIVRWLRELVSIEDVNVIYTSKVLTLLA